MPHRVIFKPLASEQSHVHDMDVSSHNQWLIFKRGKGLVPANRIVLCLLLS